jgi:hypothetical protein
MYADTPRTVVLVGRISGTDARNLTEYCSRLEGVGQLDLIIDLDGVLACDRTAVGELYALQAGRSGMHVTVRGAHWPQFLEALCEPLVEDVHTVTHQARALIGEAGHGRPPFSPGSRPRNRLDPPGGSYIHEAFG